MKNIRGEYTYQVLDKFGVPIQKPIKVDNLILDSLKTIRSNRFSSVFLEIGSGGNTPPSPSDTSLVNKIAQSSSGNMGEQVSSRVKDSEYITVRWYRSFSITGVSGLISELGLKKGSTLFTRSLITDSEGNPTEIELESDYTLQVNYSIYVRYKRHIKDVTIETPHGDIEGYIGIKDTLGGTDPLLATREDYYGMVVRNNLYSTADLDVRLSLTTVSNNSVVHILRSSESFPGGDIKLTFKVPPVSYDRYIGDATSSTGRIVVFCGPSSVYSNGLYYGLFLKAGSTPVIIPANYNFNFEITFVIGMLED